MTSKIIRSADGRDLTFYREGAEARIQRFVDRVRAELPLLAGKLAPEGDGIEAVASSGWLTREEYSGPLRDQAFELLQSRHFIQDLSSGTTGEPVVRYHAWADELGEQLMTRRCFELLGMGAEDRVACLEIGAPEISTFYFRAMAELGVRDRCFLHVSTDFQRSIEPLEGLNPTIILTVPGVLARCAPRFFEIYDGRRERAIGVGSYSFYGTTEIGGAACECRLHRGLHVMDDWILPTLRDARELRPGVFEGEVGWTAMHYSAMPLLKYEVGDVVEIDSNPCECGAPGVRLSFEQRTHDVVSVYGLKFGFTSIERALIDVLGEDPLVQLVLEDAPEGMSMKVRVCRDHLVEESKIIDALYEVFEFDEMLDMGYLKVTVEQVERSCFDQRKLRRVIDLRSATPFG
jgi:phenylacetate-coenzyme A ligase PaaK-like adenylate-forming protein